ncbi:MAG TPA: pyridoxal-dependent decarboxylase [Thermoanaerobaculia bacterium]|nr:pyridoxal-dependent decarboxylase [Thermoanaerobaculia bacterium]
MGAELPLLLDAGERERLFARLVREIERAIEEIPKGRVTPEATVAEVRDFVAGFDFASPLEPEDALDRAVRGLTAYQTHTPHPGYWGLFNPAPTTMGIAADALVAAFNPQLAVWAHSPFAVEVERRLVRELGTRFGWREDEADGAFTTGGSEANHTALLTALAAAFPETSRSGVRALAGEPRLYVSAEAHHSFQKAARASGLGTDAVRHVPVDGELRMLPSALASAIAEDRAAGRLPFLVVATAGTTNAGAVDPLPTIADVAERERLWLHADAAWGGAAALAPSLAPLLDGIQRADSITFDAHKFLSVPMGAGLYLTRRRGILEKTFRVEAPYVPPKPEGVEVLDAYERTLQWSRRFIGLKLFLSLAVAGWDGYARAIERQTEVGALLRERLRRTGWRIANATPLPIVCFDDPRLDEAALVRVAAEVVGSGLSWISTTRIGGGRLVLRACVTNYRSSERDADVLVAELDSARRGMV